MQIVYSNIYNNVIITDNNYNIIKIICTQNECVQVYYVYCSAIFFSFMITNQVTLTTNYITSMRMLSIEEETLKFYL